MQVSHKAATSHSVSVLDKAQEITKTQGKAAVKLIETAAAVKQSPKSQRANLEPHKGQHVDLKA